MLEIAPIQQALNWRYATKQFDPAGKLAEDDLAGLLDAARLSASSFGLQPWKFVVVRDPALRAKLRGSAWNQPQVTDASHLVVLCRPETLTVDDVARFIDRLEVERGMKPGDAGPFKQMLSGFVERLSDGERKTWMDRQVYIALGTLLTAAALRGIDACPMEGFDPGQFDELLDLKRDGLHAVVLCALGRRSANDGYARLKKVRYSAEEVVLNR
ncbi:MAG: NAD(P)H-dependent oxidoreductase [Candidatus Wallbacteria bacterium]|nr:NAD(P)H-dependent oxidoreductase [Candidatus Wallbacteria bacterium]